VTAHFLQALDDVLERVQVVVFDDDGVGGCCLGSFRADGAGRVVVTTGSSAIGWVDIRGFPANRGTIWFAAGAQSPCAVFIVAGIAAARKIESRLETFWGSAF
jgi:hypothetical protein